MLNWLLDKLGRAYLIGGFMWLSVEICVTVITVHLLSDPSMKSLALDWWREVTTWNFGFFGVIVGSKEFKKIGVAIGAKVAPGPKEPDKNDHSDA